ncbi:MAG: chloride channel protein [Phycisphaerae bacterium]
MAGTDKGFAVLRRLLPGRLWRLPLHLLENAERLLIVLGVVVGLVTGLGAVGFSWLIELSRELYFHHFGTALRSANLHIWLLPLLPMSGALLVGLITYYFAPEAEGHGVPEVMDAMARKAGRIRPRVAGAKAVASALTIGSGGSAGTEGPIIQIGAAIGSSLGQRLHLGVGELRVLIGCGTAAGIASIFNAPIAGVLFAIEVLLREMSLRSFLPIILASVASTTVTQAIRGHNDPIFPVPVEFMSSQPLYTFSVSEIGNYVVLGLVCGLVALAFVRLLYLSEDIFRKLPVHRVLHPVIGALLLGLLAIASDALVSHQPAPATDGTAMHFQQPAVMGNGYPVIGRSLSPHAYQATADGPQPWTIHILLVLLGAKILATCLTLGSGGSGGVFAPSLFIGASTGGAFGLLVQATGWFPDASPGGYALVGMAAVVAASIHAPLTAALMLFELTGDYAVIIPIMLAGVLGLAIAQRLCPASIYTLKLLRRGVDIYQGQDISVLRHVQVRSQMRTDPITLPPTAGLMEVVAAFVQNPGVSIFVIDGDRRLLGIITGSQSPAIMADVANLGAFLIAEDVMQETDYPTVRPDDTLADVMRRLARYRGEVPVVQDGRLVGVIWPEDVMERYNAEILKRDMASSMASAVKLGSRAERIHAVEDTSLLEVPVPESFLGKSLRSLDIRNRYNVTILLIKRHDGAGEEAVNAVPSADYAFQRGDVLLVMGPDDSLRRLERGQ